MAGTILENLSAKKLTILVSALLVCQLVCFLIGGLIGKLNNKHKKQLSGYKCPCGMGADLLGGRRAREFSDTNQTRGTANTAQFT